MNSNIKKKSKPINVLILDIEGGHGGSSKSIFHTVEYLNKSKFKPIVICKRKGIVKKYKKIGVQCEHEPDMPTFTALKKESRNFIYLVLFFIYLWPRATKFRKKIINLIHLNQIEIVHCNHISLFLLAYWLKKKYKKIFLTLHVRTTPINNYTSRLQARLSSRIFHNNIFITENEKINMQKLCNNKNLSGEVIYNSVKIREVHKPYRLPLKILVLANYSYDRGVDRIIDLASSIPKKYKKRFSFIIVGDFRLPRLLPNKLRLLGLKGKTLRDYAIKKNVGSMVTFLGHISEINKIFDKVDILIKPSRENNPWGRDIIEAIGNGKAVISIGSYDKFVNKNTGLLVTEFIEKDIVKWLLKISNNLHALNIYKKNAILTAKKFNDPKKHSLKVESFWKKVIEK